MSGDDPYSSYLHKRRMSEAGYGGIATNFSEAAGIRDGEEDRRRAQEGGGGGHPLAFPILLLLPVLIPAAILGLLTALIGFIPFWVATKLIPGVETKSIWGTLIGSILTAAIAVAWIIGCVLLSGWLSGTQFVFGEHDLGLQTLQQFTGLHVTEGGEYDRWGRRGDAAFAQPENLMLGALIMFGAPALVFGITALFTLCDTSAPVLLRFSMPIIVGAIFGLASVFATTQLIRVVAPMTPLASFFGAPIETMALGETVSGAITNDDAVARWKGEQSYDEYWIVLDSPTKLQFEVTSRFHSGIILEDRRRDLQLREQREGNITTAQSDVLPAGRYMVNIVAPAARPNRGAYSLRVTTAE